MSRRVSGEGVTFVLGEKRCANEKREIGPGNRGLACVRTLFEIILAGVARDSTADYT